MDASPRPTWRSRTWIAAGVMIALLVALLSFLGLDGPQSVAVVVTAAGVLVVGVLVWATVRSQRQRREYERSLTEWAADRAAQQERLRIARELHDLASHGLGLITMRAAAVAPLEGTAGDAERRSALVDIEQAGRSAMSELRRMLTVLREPGDEVPLHPPARLSDVPGIATAAEAFGVRVSLWMEDLGEAPLAVQATACATIREALANVGRHAGPVPASVAVERDGAPSVSSSPTRGPRGDGSRSPVPDTVCGACASAWAPSADRCSPSRWVRDSASRRACRSRRRRERRDPRPDRRRSGPAAAQPRPDHRRCRGLTVVGEAADGAGAVELARAIVPDVVLMDIRMPGLDGISATRAITTALPGTRVLVLSMLELDEYVDGALRAGASGFLLKDVRPEQLIEAIRRTHEGSRCSRRASSSASSRTSSTVGIDRRVARSRPSRRGRPRCSRSSAEGSRTQRSPAALTISMATVKTHIGSLLSKLAARDRAQLVIAAYEQGLVGG